MVPTAALHRTLQSIRNNRRQLATRTHRHQGGKNARLSSPPNFGRMLHMQDHSRNLTVHFSCSLVLLTTLENAGTVTWDEMRRPEAERSISNKAASQVGGDSPDTGGGGGPAGGGTCSEILALSSAACSESVSGVVAQLGLGKTSWVKLLSLLTLETVAMGPLFELQLQICPHPKNIYIFSRRLFIFMRLKRGCCSDSCRRSKLQQSVFPFGQNLGKSVSRCLKGTRGSNIKQSR